MAVKQRVHTDAPGASVRAHETPGGDQGAQRRQVEAELKRSLTESTRVADDLRRRSSGNP